MRLPFHPLRSFVTNQEWVSATIGVIGNLAFFAGSLFFAFDVQIPAKILFVVGSLGMLIRALGRMYVDERQ